MVKKAIFCWLPDKNFQYFCKDILCDIDYKNGKVSIFKYISLQEIPTYLYAYENRLYKGKSFGESEIEIQWCGVVFYVPEFLEIYQKYYKAYNIFPTRVINKMITRFIL